MTFRFLAAVGVAAVLALSAASANAQVSFGVAAGVNAPINSLADLAEAGYNVAGSVNFAAPTNPFGVRLEGAYNGLQLRGPAGGDVRIITGTANGVFNINKTPSSPYLIAGFGAYSRRITVDPVGNTGDKTVFGINGGGGLRFPLSGISTFLEARIHFMMGSKGDEADFQFIPVTFGIVF